MEKYSTITVICSCYAPVNIPIKHGETIEVRCKCGRCVTHKFPPRVFSSRWEAIEIVQRLGSYVSKELWLETYENLAHI